MARFVSGTVATFLASTPLPNSEILSLLSVAKLEQCGIMFRHAIPGFAARMASQEPGPLYSSTRDGANAAAFHARCDHKGPTLTLIQDTDGCVFGGYTAQSWRSERKHFLDPTACLFSIAHSFFDAPPVPFPYTGVDDNIFCCADHGPCFQYCIVIEGDFGSKCWAMVNPDGLYGISKGIRAKRPASMNLTEAFWFTPAMVEVYAL
jgi:hypothetical protein